MTKSNRETAINETLKWEGGYTNDANDPGGPTNWGITIIDARKYWKKDATAADVKAMPQSVAVDIYRKKYWTTQYYDCDQLPAGVDFTVFDFGVNSGVARPLKYLNQAKGKTPAETINLICDARLQFLKGLSTWSSFGNGWGRRVAGVRRKALQMAADASKLPRGAAVPAGILASVIAWVEAPAHLFWIIAGTIGVAALIWEIAVHINNKVVTTNVSNTK